ncbi:SCP2 sterol-binding domain-containing protein [Arundinibacter roseus]|uniref:SCP2 sterol-binding domain-containing protein n=1 Tax=Arundinibacter roseus TaxID=2070510 RepID=A0A4R4KDM4_9BACT|nr:SCP2 sterol-binding domain-containing protein [Arundinibacter roseus]TDB66037.1 SCP2 sterol-binding domain-containing protein [Arundinibacter roseus]
MSLEILTDRIRTVVGTENSMVAKVKFATDEGVIFIDTTQVPNVVTNEDQEAQCTLEISSENALKMLDGDINPMMAYMTGKLKIKGDMGIAMKIAQVFGS